MPDLSGCAKYTTTSVLVERVLRRMPWQDTKILQRAVEAPGEIRIAGRTFQHPPETKPRTHIPGQVKLAGQGGHKVRRENRVLLSSRPSPGAVQATAGYGRLPSLLNSEKEECTGNR